MTIIQEVNLYQFREAFVRMDRRDNFSYKGLEHLFNYMEEQAENYGGNYIILICLIVTMMRKNLMVSVNILRKILQ